MKIRKLIDSMNRCTEALKDLNDSMIAFIDTSNIVEETNKVVIDSPDMDSFNNELRSLVSRYRLDIDSEYMIALMKERIEEEY